VTEIDGTGFSGLPCSLSGSLRLSIQRLSPDFPKLILVHLKISSVTVSRLRQPASSKNIRFSWRCPFNDLKAWHFGLSGSKVGTNTLYFTCLRVEITFHWSVALTSFLETIFGSTVKSGMGCPTLLLFLLVWPAHFPILSEESILNNSVTCFQLIDKGGTLQLGQNRTKLSIYFHFHNPSFSRDV